MGHRNLLKRWWGRGALAVLALLLLAAGFCCLDQGLSGMDDDPVLMDLCFLMLAVPAVIPLVVGSLSRLLAMNLSRPAFAAVPLAVPKPPPRRIRFA